MIKEFTLRNALNTYESENEKLIDNNESVAIHIRRGDYISNEESNSIHGICDNSYFYKSLNYLRSNNIVSDNAKLFIFSDDIQWCKENLKFDFSTVFIEGDSKRPEVDMHLMSKCKHQIISNSTFSWWGAWLNTNPDKCIIAPKQWFKTTLDSVDIIPKQWVRI
ncbi:alpha-1,2-fucosyltransferase [Shewanella sp. DC2-4]|nr:alpha-1,2-fucosyltransferase [Shewanella sp. DC2-4]